MLRLMELYLFTCFISCLLLRVYLCLCILYRGYTLSLKTNTTANALLKVDERHPLVRGVETSARIPTTLLPISFPLTASLCRRVLGSHLLLLSTPNTRRALSLHMMHSRSRSAR